MSLYYNILDAYEYFKAHHETIMPCAVVIYEFIVRRKPTKKDWSILNLVKTVFDYLVTNKSKQGGRHI